MLEFLNQTQFSKITCKELNNLPQERNQEYCNNEDLEMMRQICNRLMGYQSDNDLFIL
jgi:hypothetical protein